MTYLATLYVFLINFLNGLKKGSRIVLYSSILFMALLFGGIYNCADDNAYQNFYSYIKTYGLTSYSSTEYGFVFLAYIGTKIGLSYRLFRTMIAVVGLYLMQKTAFEYTRKYSLVFLLYFIYPFMIDVIQFRNFLSSAIVIYSMQFIVDGSKRSNYKYLIGIIIAFSIHYIAVFFLPFVFIKKYSIRRLARVALISVPVFCILTSTPLIPNMIRNIVSEEQMIHLNFYFQRANWGFLLLWARQLSFFTLTYLCFLIIEKSDLEDNWKAFNNLIIKLNIFTIIVCFPLLMFNGNFFRLLRPILFLNYILISQLMYLEARKGFLYFGLAVFLTLIYFGMDIVTQANVKTVLIPFFQSNYYL